jgi:hypothetical protein
MDYLRDYYNTYTHTHSQKRQFIKPHPLVYAHHAIDPVKQHHWAGFFPHGQFTKNHYIHIDQYPTLLFQHAPQFHYQPHTSNIDVDLH